MTQRKKYAVIGTSNRAYSMFMDPMLKTYVDYAEFVAMLDPDTSRMENYNLTRNCNIPMYQPDQFDQMIEEVAPDSVIIACRDHQHHEYIIKALEKNIDVIVEKPITSSVEYCEQIATAAQQSAATIRVTFNCRYMPAATRIRQLITEGKVGKIVSVDLNWCVDTYHGSSYFQRWNRERKLSGGLSVHKSCHHLDLVQWWIDQKPEEVFSYGTRTFFGSNGIHNPLTQEQIGDGRTCPTCDCREKCRYYMQWFREEFRGGKADENLDQFASAARTYTGYSHRQCIYDPEIDIEDNYAAVIRYDDGAVLNYSVNFSTPYEGFRLAINGTEGRIEFNEIHAPNRLPFPASEVDDAISYFPLFGGREKIDVLNQGGNHGGGDPLLLDELFIGPDPTCSTPRQASFSEGIDVVLTGLAISRSVQENRPIPMQEMRAEVYKNKTV